VSGFTSPPFGLVPNSQSHVGQINSNPTQAQFDIVCNRLQKLSYPGIMTNQLGWRLMAYVVNSMQ
jgi:hypothetical protein